jgi:site-specific recombinase XerD
VWKLTVRTPADENGETQRVHRTVGARNEREATAELARFVAEVASMPVVAAKRDTRVSMDDAVERFLTEHLGDERGREDKTIRDYRALHRKWFSPTIGRRLVREVDRASIDRAFGQMRSAGLSRSRLNQAKSLYAPFFRWACHRGLARVNPMSNFELPTSLHVASERTPPEVEELCLLLRQAVITIPDVAPVLVLGAATSMRRGELVGLRRSRIRWEDLRLTVDSAIDGIPATPKLALVHFLG